MKEFMTGFIGMSGVVLIINSVVTGTFNSQYFFYAYVLFALAYICYKIGDLK